MSQTKIKNTSPKYSKKFQQEALEDFRTVCVSREVSILGRKEVLTGKAKFGIFGAGKEVAQVAMARVFKNGDFRSGYYRGQTFMLAAGLATVENLYAQLYAHADPKHEPFSAGRQMNSHFATPLVDEDGEWLDHTATKNVSADISPTGGQMARALGLALASKKYKNSPELATGTNFSKEGNEVSFCCIGDASTSEGVFWETMNAAGVMQVPLAVFVWDDGYGISVPKEYQTTKGSISEALAGFQPKKKGEKGVDIYKTKGWNYADMRAVFEKGVDKTRGNHTPCLFHVEEVTQPQGHSTSGSHERYKDAERLKFEKEQDGVVQMKQWLIDEGFATLEELDAIRKEVKKEVRASIKAAWSAFNASIQFNLNKAQDLLGQVASESAQGEAVAALKEKLAKSLDPTHKDVVKTVRQVLYLIKNEQGTSIQALATWANELVAENTNLYTSNLYSESKYAALNISEVPAQYSADAPMKNGFEVLNACFDYHLTNNPTLFAFGEDVGNIGDVNQGFAGMQAKHGEARVFDTGIREWTIMGQAIGMSMRGLRPIAEIQYLDYLIYSLSALSDDLATLRYRSNAIQKAPAIIRTRGHRLEGIWHSGSPIGLLLNSLKGICLLVPRNMTQAAGFYNTMLQSDDPALIIECLNGYRLKEQLPDNVHEFTVPVGVPEVLQTGTDVTLVTYGSSVRIAEAAIEKLAGEGISVELIDVQSLMPFDVNHLIVDSLKKTNRLVLFDEDFAGGATAFMMHKILVEQKGYYALDSEPVNIHAADVRPPYGSDGDYFTKPSVENVFEKIYALMHETQPERFPPLYFM
jgi:pyruvate/2-oxoglutarate/acetoin dehydrogenase E1 component/TPP-dependent pyruvate/acetoin dehydrogenase alpha subunit